MHAYMYEIKRLYLLLLLCFLSPFIYGDAESTGIVSSGFQWVDLRASTRTGARSLKSLSNSEDPSELVALLNGTIYLEDPVSGQVLWSFSSGAPIYSSYQAPFNEDNDNENASGPSTGFFVDYGDDWQLYAHGKHSTGMKLSMNIEDFIKITPHISEDGSIILGSKKTTVFVVEANTGKLVRTFSSPDLPSILLKDEKVNASSDGDKNNKDVAMPRSSNIGHAIYITRTDYALQTFGPNSDKVSWSMKVAAIEAAFLCTNVENPTSPLNSSDEDGSEIGNDFEKMFSCPSRRMVVRRQNKLLSSSGAIHGDEKLLLPASNEFHERRMLPVSVPNPAHPLQPKSDEGSNFHLNNEGQGTLAFPNDSILLDVHNVLVSYYNIFSMFLNGSTAFSVILFILIVLFGFLFHLHVVAGKEKVALDGQFSGTNVKSKRKKNRKSGTNNCNIETKVKATPSENEDRIEGDNKGLLDLNKLVDCGASGYRIGKLIVSNIEIAKGSNGTIVLEGVYEGRPVAVKRLVRAHHDVAFKEIQNLIASDRHPNIVRWYGVEFDKDFVYLSLERCTCSLDDLIQICSNYSLNRALNKDQASITAIEYKLRFDSVDGIMQDLNLWKPNGHPSSLLLKFMRDMVSGLVHLHELGIIHRDLKPQNVLIVKEKSLSAKLSDMGISKQLHGDMSSLGHHVTGCGSSGWQAPEQLLHGRQTRAIDLFSLGCVLFYCITGGKHPFGDHLERDINIVKNQMDLFLVDFFPEAENLIYRLLNPYPELRPKTLEVLRHPMFWSSETRLSFLRDTSDRAELENRESNSELLKALENIAPTALGGKWDEKMEPAFINNIGHYRRYKFDSVRDLLRVMRNKLNHYRELPKEIQELLGSVPEGYDGYFASRFPKLLTEVYKVVHAFCQEEECFQKYFKGSTF